jgi:Tol biopolymer transport system component/predicted Ser/Thr protein kinase
MALEAGKRLGTFEVLEPIGAGGMGEVYRARDTRLDRTVALKVLPSELSANPALRERLEREARLASSLAHPHICTLHDVGRDQGVDFLVMEYLEGESLADRLQKGPLPVEQAVRYAIEIAEALDTAHRQGIVHRDLKPGNVMLTKSGAKLLDFGLAKLREGDPSDPGTSASAIPTQNRPLTELGTILGTYPYMAPEQLEGKETDGRTDVFAFGALLYEMVTGRRAFRGESRASLIAAILEREPPPVSTLQPLTPPGLDHVVKTCLAKDPDDRWQSAHDLASGLRWITEAGSRAGIPAPVVRRRKTRERIAWGAAALGLVVAVGASLALWATHETPRVVRSSLLPPDGARFEPSYGAMALSPDGTRLAFVASEEDGGRMLWVRSLSALTAQPLAGTEEARHPFWSPDGRYIGFFSRGKLRKIDASGGPPQALCDVSGGRGGTWSADGTILFTPSTTDVIYQVAASGGTPAPVTTFDESRGERSHRFPRFLPDGRHFLFLVQAPDGTPDTDGGFAIFGASLDSTEKKPIVASRASARYASSGHLLFIRDRTLVAQPFDPDALELSGDAVPVAENMSRTGRYEAIFSVSDTGLLLYQPGAASEDSRLVWLDRDGSEQGTVGRPADYRIPVLSHDRKRIAASVRDPQSQQADIWILDIERGTSTRLTFDPAYDVRPLWSADDRTIYFASNRSGGIAEASPGVGGFDIYSKASAGTGTAELVYGGEAPDYLWSLSSDGRTGWLLSNNMGRTGWDISRLDLESGEAAVFLQAPFQELGPVVSPDGHWLLYSSDESGRNEVYVQSLGDDGGKWQISTDGGIWGEWTRDGREIVYRGGDGTLMAVGVTFEPTFAAGIPEALFDPRERDAVGPQYDVTPDGLRFLVNQPLEQSVVEPLILVQNWARELER